MEILILKGKIATGRNGCLYFTEVASFMWALLHHLAMQVTVMLKSKATVSSQLCPTSRRHPHTVSQTNAHEGQRQGIDSTWGWATFLPACSAPFVSKQDTACLCKGLTGNM